MTQPNEETEVGYTELDPSKFPPGYLERLAEELGKECPNPDCICKR